MEEEDQALWYATVYCCLFGHQNILRILETKLTEDKKRNLYSTDHLPR